MTIREAKTQLSRSLPLVRLQVLEHGPKKRILGKYPNLLCYIAPDFSEAPEDFADYTA